jgi:hypothetical protein
MDEFNLQPAPEQRVRDFGAFDAQVAPTTTTAHVPTREQTEAYYAQQGRTTRGEDFGTWETSVEGGSFSTNPGTAPVFTATPPQPMQRAQPVPQPVAVESSQQALPWYYPVAGLLVAYLVLKALSKKG